jgi:hypothetical protein
VAPGDDETTAVALTTAGRSTAEPGRSTAAPVAPVEVFHSGYIGSPPRLVEVDPQAGPTGFADQPLGQRALQSLDLTIAEAEHSTGLRFAAFLGDLGEDTRANAEGLVADLGDDAAYAVLVAISPGQRVVEVVTGTEAALRVSDRAARLAVLSVLAACESGDLPRALENGIRVLADQAGAVPEVHRGW